MIARELISSDILPLRTSDTGEEAIAHMNVYHVRHMPIVNNEDFLGLISEDDILNHDLEESVGSYTISFTGHSNKETDHLFDIMKMMANNKLSVVPIVNAKNKYLGLITLESLLQHFANSYGLSETGSIVVLEVARNNYSLSEIARIVESEGGIIIATHLSKVFESTNLHVTLKISTNSLSQIIATFQRYDYIVTGTFTKEEFHDVLKDRYNSLIRFLEV